MSTEDRDRTTERLIRAGLRREAAEGPPATASCVDAETFAAWSDGTLSPTGAAGVEAHLADCVRCQAMMAAFAQSAPAAAAAVIPMRPRMSIKWFVPLAAGTLAASLLVWLAWPTRQAPIEPASTMARADAPAPAPPAAPPPVAPPAASAAQAASAAKLDRAESADKKNEARSQSTRDLKDSAALRKAEPPPPASLPVGSANSATGRQVQMTTPVPPPVVATEPPPPTAPAQVFRSATGTGALSPPAEAKAAVTVLAEFSSPDPAIVMQGVSGGVAAGGSAGGGARGGGGGRGGRGGGGGGAAAAGQTDVASPLVVVRWRVLTNGAVEHSLNAGVSWNSVPLPNAATQPQGGLGGTPAQTFVTTGTAPTSRICWLVGRGGLVLLSVDGQNFTHVTFPETVDLTSIRATSARAATVTTADGRMFTTTDGGQTWR